MRLMILLIKAVSVNTHALFFFPAPATYRGRLFGPYYIPASVSGGSDLITILTARKKTLPATLPEDLIPTIKNTQKRMAAWRARKLSDCLADALATYEKLHNQYAAAYVENVYGPFNLSAIGTGAFLSSTSWTSRLGSGIVGVAVNTGFNAAYYGMADLALNNAYDRDWHNCYSLYGPR